MERDTATAEADQGWRTLVGALPGDKIAVVDPTGRMVDVPEWIEIVPSPWSSLSDLFDPLNESDRTRVRAALIRAQSEQGQATTVARLAGSSVWSLISFLDATDGPDINGIVVAWISSLDEPQRAVGEQRSDIGPLHGPWLAETGDRSDTDPGNWIDAELGPAAAPAPTASPIPDPEADQPLRIELEIEDLPVPAAFLDRDGEFAVANRRWYQLLGLTVGDGSTWLDGFEPDDVARLEALAGNSSEVDTTVRAIDPNGATRWIRIRGLSRPEERGAGGVWILDDVTDNVVLVGTIADLERQVADAIDDDDETKLDGTTTAVLVIGVEGLSRVRNAHGEAAADMVLTATGERLRTILRPHDHVGQLASDEFAVVCTRMRGGDGALSVANRIVAELESPFEIGGDEFAVSTSVGVAVTDNPMVDPSVLLAEATAARNDARRKGVAIAALHESG